MWLVREKTAAAHSRAVNSSWAVSLTAAVRRQLELYNRTTQLSPVTGNSSREVKNANYNLLQIIKTESIMNKHSKKLHLSQFN